MKFSLQETAAQAGLSKKMVRALEVRYSVIHSLRDSRGRLCYSKDDIIRLQIFARAISKGINIKTIAHCSNEELNSLLESHVQAESDTLFEYINEAKTYIREYNAADFEKLLYNCRIELDRERLILDFIFPLIQNKDFSPSERSFLELELLVFLSQIIQSAYTKEYYPTLVIISDTPSHRNFALAVGALLASLPLNISFAACTKSLKTITHIYNKTNCDAILYTGNFKTEELKVISQHKQLFFTQIDFSAQELIDTNFSVEKNVLKEIVLLTIKNIQQALNF